MTNYRFDQMGPRSPHADRDASEVPALEGDERKQTEPKVLAFDPTGNAAALRSGHAVGPVDDESEWSVEEIVAPGLPNVTLTFVSEAAARAHWRKTGGQLMRTDRTSWTLAPDWAKRAQRPAEPKGGES